MDVQKKLDEIVEAVEGARSMPMSASCVVNRAELLARLGEVREALPGSLAQAQQVIGSGEQLVEQARQEADRILESAHAERGSLISDTAVARQSQDEADRILAKARAEAEEIRQEADEYVDSKLANFEVVLTKTLGSVGRGREKLLGTGQGLDAQGYEDPDFTEAPERSQDPETLRQRADAYVDVKLGAFEAVLSKTLDAVGRGRQKLQGRVASDDLGQLGAFDEHGHQHLASDADYLADLAEPQQQQSQQSQQSQQQQSQQAQPHVQQAQQQHPEHAPQHQHQQQHQQQQQHLPPQQDHSHQQYQPAQPQTPPPPPPMAPAPIPAQQQYAPQGQDPYGYQQQDPYAYQQMPPDYAQQDPYAYQQQDPYAYQQQSQDYGPQGFGPGPDGMQMQGFYDGGGQQPDPAQQQAPALDETSLFDTSMISVDQLREYEQGRGQGQ
ncbi:cell division initiation protein [Streptomyces sp. LHD-70]|uniref:cell division initiation protein n=1 Tax=Streptomyces sp. LHD-70 TaxID=3072140 RepID=UPI00280E1089|nr:cell division initiation protein [Streptomyces sp. LHD-70]MDQ8701876.1 cell division initiation protein [Streptomyces sp. LHD-70]